MKAIARAAEAIIKALDHDEVVERIEQGMKRVAEIEHYARQLKKQSAELKTEATTNTQKK